MAVDQFFNSSSSSVSVCQSLAAEKWGTYAVELPWVCNNVTYGDLTWGGLFCYPFWDYAPLNYLLLMVVVYAIRMHSLMEARRWKAEWRSQKPSQSFDLLPQSGKFPAPAGERLLPVEETKPSIPPGNDQSSSCCPGLCKIADGVGQIVAFLVNHIFRFLVQLFQWWVCAIILLVLCICGQGIELNQKFHLWNAMVVPHFNGTKSIKPDEFNEIPDRLAWFSMYSLVAIVLIYAVSIVCILAQVLVHEGSAVYRDCWSFFSLDGSSFLSQPRDVTVQVLLLPMVYSCLALRSVSCIWFSIAGKFPGALACDHFDDNWQKISWNSTDAQNVLLEVYEANFALADVYEAWALFQFARLLASVLGKKLEDYNEEQHVQALQDLITIDVRIFWIVGYVTAVIRIATTWTRWRLGFDLCKAAPVVCVLSPYLVGANWCVSSVAIYNLVSVEHRFHDVKKVRKFGPLLKFWSIKLMVMVSFWSGLFIDNSFMRQLFELNAFESKLLDASLRIYAMGLVTILNVAAWFPCAGWVKLLDEDEGLGGSVRSFKGRDLEHIPPGTISLVLELFEYCEKPSDFDAKVFEDVEKIIDGLSRDELARTFYLGSQIGWAAPSNYSIQALRKREHEDHREQAWYRWSDSPGGRKVSQRDEEDVEASRQRRAVWWSTEDEQRDYLKLHLRGFYPDLARIRETSSM